MDNQKLGNFISILRKKKGWTQLELAEKLHVTDKAVSKWERGVGYPDIKLLEPLAKLLDVSVIELIRSEKIDNENRSIQNVIPAFSNLNDYVAYQRKIEQRNIITTAVLTIMVVSLFFLIEYISLFIFIFSILPIISLGIGITLIVICSIRRKHKLSFTITFIAGIVFLIVPVLLFLILFFVFKMGSPTT